MKFVAPKNDVAFRKIFGSEQSHDILIEFLGILHIGVYTLNIYAAIFQNLTLVRTAHPTR